MKHLSSRPMHAGHYLSIAGLAAIILVAMALWLAAPAAHALPEYATRTGEQCGACHVSPGGGGPRTLRGLLWAARGRPDQIPALPVALIAPGVEDGLELYDIACAACHGTQGEGLFAMGLVETGVSPASIRSFVRRGIPLLGMPAFEGQFTDDQLEVLVAFVAQLASGEAAPPPSTYPLPPALFRCAPTPAPTSAGCGRAPLSYRGN